MTIKGMSVRQAMRRLQHKTAVQREAVQEMRSRAEVLTASGQAVAKAKQVNPPPLCFVEVAGEGDLSRGFFPDGMVSGVGIAVSDALDVCEFRTRYGVESQMLHRVPHREFPFVSWLRRHGAQFIGKLACRTPLSMGEASLIDAEHPAAVAVSENACNYAISSALMGPAAITSPIHYDVAAFKPTAQSFATFTDGYRLSIPSMSVGITAARLDDIFYLWEVFTSAIQHSSTDEKPHGGTGGDSKSGDESKSISGEGSGSGSGDTSEGSGGRHHRHYHLGSHHVHHPGVASGEELLEKHIELSVGYPANWIDQLCKERLLSGDEFRRRILRLASTRNVMQKNEQLEVTPITIDIDLEAVVKAIQTISLYELAQAFDRVFPAASSDGKPIGGLSSSGALEELPDELVSAIFRGKVLTHLDYHRALRTRDNVVRATDEQFRDVDLIVTPILSMPYVNGSMRSIAPILPFSLGGNPIVSVQLESDLPVALVGELGRDTGLFEDSTTFLKFVRGTSPGWWRRRFARKAM